jgi:ATP/maltotriose-dependent transcriptional regulator MalT
MNAIRIALTAVASRVVLLTGAVLCLSLQAQRTDSLREASLIDDMLCHGDYIEALKLTSRDVVDSHLDRGWLAPYIGALFIETGKLAAADQVLNSRPAEPSDQGSRSAVVRERAALLLAQGEYQLAATEALEAYKLSTADRIYESRRAYAGSIAAESLLRSGDLNGARQYADKSLRAVRKQTRARYFFVPRVFHAACLVASYGPNPESGEPICLRGLELAKQSKKQRRDLSLGYLVLAEARLENARFDLSREAANQSLTLTQVLFGPVHQDAVKAHEIIALADLRSGNRAEAQKEAESALSLAKKLFGIDSRRVTELKRTLEAISN